MTYTREQYEAYLNKILSEQSLISFIDMFKETRIAVYYLKLAHSNYHGGSTLRKFKSSLFESMYTKFMNNLKDESSYEFTVVNNIYFEQKFNWKFTPSLKK